MLYYLAQKSRDQEGSGLSSGQTLAMDLVFKVEQGCHDKLDQAELEPL